MMELMRHPKLRQVARDLELPASDDALRDLREHAVERVRNMMTGWTLDTVEDLRMRVADQLSVKLVFITSDDDIYRIAAEFAHYKLRHVPLPRLLEAEFITGDTEGLLLDNPSPVKGSRRYLAIIDARGPRAARAYFTGWHELAHLLLCPPRQRVFDGFRRSPSELQRRKDPLESAVDHIAGLLAFWEPIFKPALITAAGGDLTFAAIETAAVLVAPGASLYAASLAATRVWDGAAVFVICEEGTKTDGTGLALRIQTLIPNDHARSLDLSIRRSMRVPIASALWRAFYETSDTECAANENQALWEVAGRGNLPKLPWAAQAVRRGGAVYAILKPTASRGLRRYAGNLN
jgi:hypothetical protein